MASKIIKNSNDNYNTDTNNIYDICYYNTNSYNTLGIPLQATLHTASHLLINEVSGCLMIHNPVLFLVYIFVVPETASHGEVILYYL